LLDLCWCRDCGALLLLLLAVQQHGETSAGKFWPLLAAAMLFHWRQQPMLTNQTYKPLDYLSAKPGTEVFTVCILLAMPPAAETCTVTVNVTYVGVSFNQILDYQVIRVQSLPLTQRPLLHVPRLCIPFPQSPSAIQCISFLCHTPFVAIRWYDKSAQYR
jgi:hypothetical protein